MNGSDLIAAERKRQIEEEGWDQEHDSEHTDEELAWAAVAYAAPENVYRHCCVDTDDGKGEYHRFASVWPDSWTGEWFEPKRHDRIKQLTIAGALIAAEIDRLQSTQ